MTGLLVLALRKLGGSYIVDALVANGSAQTAAGNAWEILTRQLADGGWTFIGLGVVLLVAVWISGVGRSATAARTELAPFLARAEIAFGAAAVLFALLIDLGPDCSDDPRSADDRRRGVPRVRSRGTPPDDGRRASRGVRARSLGLRARALRTMRGRGSSSVHVRWLGHSTVLDRARRRAGADRSAPAQAGGHLRRSTPAPTDASSRRRADLARAPRPSRPAVAAEAAALGAGDRSSRPRGARAEARIRRRARGARRRRARRLGPARAGEPRRARRAARRVEGPRCARRLRAARLVAARSSPATRTSSPGLEDIVSDLDLALIPIWGWGASLGTGHLDPTRAAEAVALLRPRVAVPIHWGTFRPVHRRSRAPFLRDPVDEFVAAARERAPDVEIRVLAPGESLTMQP